MWWSWAYFILSLLLALCAFAAVAPAVRGPLSILQFFFGWLPCEMPLHFAAGTALLTLIAWATGALEAEIGIAGLVLCLIAIAALLICAMRTRLAAPALEAALRAALGDYNASIPPERAALLRQRVPISLLLRPFRLRLPPVAMVSNLAYGEHGERNLLDIYLPPEGMASCPVLLWVHGGAWVVGNKTQQGQPLLRHLASRGWVCVAINYRLGPVARFPDPLVDVKRALAWIRENISQYRGDPGFVAIAGGSAGGHLASLVALNSMQPQWQVGFEQADTSVAAVVSLYGRYDFLDRADVGDIGTFLEQRVMPSGRAADAALWMAASPLDQVHPDAPPFFVVHGTHDPLIPIPEARMFVDALRKVATKPVVYAELNGATHAFEQFHTPRGEPTIDAVQRFLEFLYAGYAKSVGQSVGR